MALWGSFFSIDSFNSSVSQGKKLLYKYLVEEKLNQEGKDDNENTKRLKKRKDVTIAMVKRQYVTTVQQTEQTLKKISDYLFFSLEAYGRKQEKHGEKNQELSNSH